VSGNTRDVVDAVIRERSFRVLLVGLGLSVLHEVDPHATYRSFRAVDR